MTDTNIVSGKISSTGRGGCDGGSHPELPLHNFPLLTWDGEGKPVRTEDGKATVEEIALASAVNANIAALASKFGTSEDHVTQAISYASRMATRGK